MKTLFLLSLLSLFISVAFSDPGDDGLSANHQFPQLPVFTADGHVLTVGTPYYVLTNIFKPVGLCLTDVKKNHSAAHGVCPHDVVQCSNHMQGLPITFTPVYPTVDPFVRENTPYHLRLVVAGKCALETAVALTFSENIHRWFIHTETVTLLAQFQLQRSGLGYRISFCLLNPIPHAPAACCNAGFRVENGNTRMGVGEGITEAEFYFRKHHTAVDADTSAASS